MSEPPPSSSLYGMPRPKSKSTASKKDISSSSTLAFTTHLSSLISSSSAATGGDSGTGTTSTSRARSRPSRVKDDIFSTHNKNAQKRAAKDLSDDSPATAIQQVHKRGADIGGDVDAATLHRSKRRLEEKAKLYDDLRRGEHLLEDDSDDGGIYGAGGNGADQSGLYRSARRKEREALVDFDRKWAEEEAPRMRAQGSDGDSDSSFERDDADPAEGPGTADVRDEDLIEFEDEFGRSRRGTKAEAARARLQQQQQRQRDTSADDGHPPKVRGIVGSRPSRPDNLIYGSAVQADAFDPDASITAQMAHLASRRDRSPTPTDVHYDADAEVRNRGTGFYAFSKDQSVREQEMADLLKEREETERTRKGEGGAGGSGADAVKSMDPKRAERERKKEERRRKIEEARGKRRADVFLEGLGGLPVPGVAVSSQAGEKETPRETG